MPNIIFVTSFLKEILIYYSLVLIETLIIIKKCTGIKPKYLPQPEQKHVFFMQKLIKTNLNFGIFFLSLFSKKQFIILGAVLRMTTYTKKSSKQKVV